MGSEWRDMLLGDVITLKRGYDLPSSQRRPGSVPVVSSAGITALHAEAKVSPPGVVTGRYGTIGTVYYIDQPFWPLNTTLYVEDFKGNDPRFVSYLLKTIDFQQYSDKAAVPGVNRNHLHTARVQVPPLTVQREIAGFLSILEQRIDVFHEANDTLEAMARAIFKSWFIDFDPVRMKSHNEEPEGMDAETAGLFPAEFEESVLGPIPKGWRIATITESMDINPRRDLPRGSVATYLDMAGTPTTGHRPVAVTQREFGSGVKFVNGDTLLAKITPCLENGKTAYVDFLPDDQVGWGSTEFIVLRPKPPLPPFFGYLLARFPPFRAFAIQSMSGSSGRQRVELSRLAQFRLVVPEPQVALAFEQVVEPIRARIAGAIEQMATLSSLRDTLLPHLMSGRLRIPEAQEAVEEALTV